MSYQGQSPVVSDAILFTPVHKLIARVPVLFLDWKVVAEPPWLVVLCTFDR